ncbi:hypothetical protein ABZO31_27835 [Streptomyces sp. HUAS MG47]|uniref:hypothetical protein n=1 Tax=Streptomyces solicamelliae TaxID=3231716 RepID=UPI003877B50F
MRISHPRTAAALVTPLLALLVSCSAADPSGPRATPTPDGHAAPSQAGPATDAASSAPGPAASPEPAASPAPEKVRDAFAGLQATLNDTCTPGAGDCAYFLGRVHDELDGLDRAMHADPKGPGHFPEPIKWIADLRTELGGDTSTANLEKHKGDLTGTRDRINTWMQDHPDDYR